MERIILLGLIAILTIWQIESRLTADRRTKALSRQQARLERLWGLMLQKMRQDKLLEAEKILLTILRLDDKNAAAYNRLGILYARQKEFNDAISCFEIASTINLTASSLHNLGTIYYETEQYEKSSLAFKKAIELQDDLAVRYLNYAKSLERLGHQREMMTALEKVVNLEPTQEALAILKKTYQSLGYDDKANAINQQQKELIVATNRPQRLRRPAKTVVF